MFLIITPFTQSFQETEKPILWYLEKALLNIRYLKDKLDFDGPTTQKVDFHYLEQLTSTRKFEIASQTM